MNAGIEAVRRAHEAELLALPNVIGVGIGERGGERVIKVFVERKLPLSQLAPQHRVPKTLDGYRCVVEALGSVSVESV